MSTPDKHPDNSTDPGLTDPVFDKLLDEAFSARHLPAPTGMNDRILKAVARAQHQPLSDAQDAHVAGSIGIVRWVWVGLAAAALFAVSGVLLMQGTTPETNNAPIAQNTDNDPDSTPAPGAEVAILEAELTRFKDLGGSGSEPLDSDMAALNNKIDQMNKMWVTDPMAKEPGIEGF